MRYREIICECDVTSPAFKNWFAGSQVTDQTGKPLLCYHGTHNSEFDEFAPLSHFGTANAANDRLMISLQNCDDRNHAHLDGQHVRPVYLSIKNPYHYEDDGEDHPAAYSVIDQMRNSGEATQDEHEHIMSFQRRGRDVSLQQRWSQLSEAFIEYMRSKGYDGLTYNNKIEDPGSKSWAIFDPKQVWPAFRD